MADDHDIWPECSACGVPYVHRYAMSWSEGRKWVWQQDCKHGRKGNPQPVPVLMTKNGPYEPVA